MDMAQDGLLNLPNVFHAKIHLVLLVLEVHYQHHQSLAQVLSRVKITPFVSIQQALMAVVTQERSFMVLFGILEDAQLVHLDMVAQADTFLATTTSSSAE
jgi:hypothetical protein